MKRAKLSHNIFFYGQLLVVHESDNIYSQIEQLICTMIFVSFLYNSCQFQAEFRLLKTDVLQQNLFVNLKNVVTNFSSSKSLLI